ncbi:GNAT family N-acetyltransferase [Flavobacterium cyanobacteriorum]|uniref:GNAT family N-acetyltransferase n=1 Tax=Flavobacterium cyanobacteriorum TaxID=2022802 RepID=A0A255YYU8_9FLAO|nr:GNAT family N-acetyltransferase [Flavobacterium cyanobacteriorum]OYQ34423.1 GNAT family N-acetyltransferase [Flavobacterium cyanobacteriorum]
MNPEFKIKRFDELSLPELYQVLQLRSEVFVVEQNCVYQDIDGKDEEALHLLGIYEGAIVAYCRLFAAGDYFDNASVGRVVISSGYRDRKWGHDMKHEAIKAIETFFGTKSITISAQLYLKKFYESHGFLPYGEQYLEDGIPHIRMERGFI